MVTHLSLSTAAAISAMNADFLPVFFCVELPLVPCRFASLDFLNYLVNLCPSQGLVPMCTIDNLFSMVTWKLGT